MPFNKYHHNESVTNQGDYTGFRKNDYLGRRFQISLSYRFGKLKASVKKTETTIENNDVVGGITKGQKQCKMSKQNIIINFPSKSLIDSIKSTTFAPTRTRQASPRCSNVRVVLFLYNEQQNSIPEALHQCAQPCLSLAVKRLDGYRYSKG